MIQRLNYKQYLDIYDLLHTDKDLFEDFYITINQERVFLNNDAKLIKKILNTQEVYGFYKRGLQGLLIIYKEKGFRPYLKIFANNLAVINDLMKFFVWNKNDIEIFCKMKLENPIVSILRKYGFFIKGNRGKEILLLKKGFKNTIKIQNKDIGDNND